MQVGLDLVPVELVLMLKSKWGRRNWGQSWCQVRWEEGLAETSLCARLAFAGRSRPTARPCVVGLASRLGRPCVKKGRPAAAGPVLSGLSQKWASK